MVRLSIIIAATRDASALEDTLVSVLTHRPSECEILVAHAGTYDDPYGVGEEIRLLECDAGSHNQLIAAAMEAAVGEIIHLLAPGCEVTDGWCDAAIACFDSPEVGSVSPVLVSESEPNVLGVAGGFTGRKVIAAQGEQDAKRVAKIVIGPTSLAAFYCAAALDAVGGWPTEMSSQSADIDVALSLKELGYQTSVADESLISQGGAKVASSGAFRRAVDQEQLFWRHESSYLGRALRPMTAFVQCAIAGMPWSIVAACCGKLMAQSKKPTAQAHRQRIAAACEREDEMTVASDDGDELRRAA